MPETWKGVVESAQLVRVSPTRRVLLLGVRYSVLEAAGGLELRAIPLQLRYAARLFRGMTLVQAWQLIRDEGAGDVPALLEIGADILQDWLDADPIRRIEPGQEFGPS